MGKKVASGNKDAATLICDESLFLGPASAASSHPFLSSHSITHILSIGATPAETFPNISYHRLSLADSPSSSIDKVSEQAATIIDAALASNNGAGRILRRGMSLLEALGTIVRARPTVTPNAGFLAQLKALERSLFGTLSIEADELPRKKEDRVAFFSQAPQTEGLFLNHPSFSV
ncbi:hypothetical protein C8J57DRAFT_1444288 [Mycena rebaudengoi]|nr:hypothetical protein C8J57DRAFT_1444288 [Mycena rebaudengoi]